MNRHCTDVKFCQDSSTQIRYIYRYMIIGTKGNQKRLQKSLKHEKSRIHTVQNSLIIHITYFPKDPKLKFIHINPYVAN